VTPQNDQGKERVTLFSRSGGWWNSSQRGTEGGKLLLFLTKKATAALNKPGEPASEKKAKIREKNAVGEEVAGRRWAKEGGEQRHLNGSSMPRVEGFWTSHRIEELPGTRDKKKSLSSF